MMYYEILRLEREKRNLKRKEVAEALNIKPDTYCKYEKGTNEPDISTLIQFANYYKISLDYLLGRYEMKAESR